MNIKTAKFVVSNQNVNDCPKENIPEYAFIGRSNVGKSSLINMLANNKKLSPDEQFQARLKLSKIPRNASKVRIRNRCVLTGRGRGIYRKFQLSRITFRELAAKGQIPGITKSSW